MAKDKWADRDYVLKAVRRCGEDLEYADESLQADREVVLEAVKLDGYALQYAAKKIQNDPVVKRVVRDIIQSIR